MANPTTRINYKKTDPTLSDLLTLSRKQTMLDLNCHAIAVINSFNPENQTVTATIAYKQTVLQKGQDEIYKTVLKDYPAMIDMPLVILGGGSANLTFPTSQIEGAECIVLFNDRDLDNWFQSGQNLGPASGRLHSFADGIALLGVRSLAKSLSDYDEERAALSYGETKVGVGETLILLNNAAGVSLGTSLTDLTAALTNLTTLLTTAFASPTPSPGSPLYAAWAAAIIPINTAIADVQTAIEGLLE